MGNLSENFSRHEFECRCCGRLVLDMDLVDALQELRDAAGGPIRVNSGYRCPEHNRKVGGSPTSQHLVGKAADIVIEGYSVIQMFAMAIQIKRFHDGGIGRYHAQNFIHVDVRGWRSRWVFET